MARPAAFVIAVLGAESTGKTTLAHSLRTALATPMCRVAVVDEYLREFCVARGRTPGRAEQQDIADEQTRRITAAAADHDIVIADTTALMIAVYSDQVFGDTSLYAGAQAAHSRCDLTLLTALDIAWQPDGLQRDGPQVRAPVDARVRAALGRAGLGYSVVTGAGAARTVAALAGVKRALHRPPTDASPDAVPWRWHCERCGDANGERHPLLRPLPPR
jgi:nicotinamide riboside kinase